MNRVCSIFSQILKLISRGEFQVAVQKHQAERHARGFSSWSQMIAMLFCQLGHAQSLREITGGLAACEGKLRHLGVEEPPKRSTLSYANEHRPWQLFETVFHDLLKRCQAEANDHKRKFRFKHKLLSLDSTVIPLCLSVFDWAQYKRAKGAVKLHMVLDHDGYLPSYAVMTEGKTADITAAKRMTFAPGTMLVFDRGYADYGWWLSLTRQKVHFVSRLKDSAEYGIVEQRAVADRGNIIRDEVIVLCSQQEIGAEACLRRIEVWIEEKQETMVFITNNLTLAASTIAAVYKERWQIEIYASHCTSFAEWRLSPGCTVWLPSFTPCFSTGVPCPICSYRQSPFSLYWHLLSRPNFHLRYTVCGVTPNISAISSFVSNPIAWSRS